MPLSLPHLLNWTFGWWLLFSGFLTGAALGLFFHREEFLGGYNSWTRRLCRLGHIAQVALGMLNVLYGLSPLPEPATVASAIASAGFIAGGVSMPLVCFLSAWRPVFRHFFFVPVLSLGTAVVLTALAGSGGLR